MLMFSYCGFGVEINDEDIIQAHYSVQEMTVKGMQDTLSKPRWQNSCTMMIMDTVCMCI